MFVKNIHKIKNKIVTTSVTNEKRIRKKKYNYWKYFI